MADVKVTLVRSLIGCKKDQIATAYSLGLKKMHSSVVQEDTPDILGKCHAIAHLVTVEKLDD